jgi:hypothetical protein
MKRLYNAIADFFIAITSEKVDYITMIDRQVICSLCEHKRKKNVLGYKIEHCGICKCPIKNKTKFKYSNCPKNKWN